MLLVLALNTSSVALGFHSSDSSFRANSILPLASAKENGGIQIQVIDEQHSVLELTAPPFMLRKDNVDGIPCQVMYAPGYASSETPGWPDLPATGALLGIPAGAQPSLKVLEVETISVPGRYDLCPVSQPVIQKDPFGSPIFQGEVRSREAQVYASAEFIPAELAQIGSYAFIRSQRVAQIRFQPYQYKPASRELRYTRRLRVEVSFFPAGAKLPTSPGSSIPEGSFEGFLRQTLLNYDQARTWRVQPSQTATYPSTFQSNLQANYKILVDQDGIYELSYTDLKNAGVPVDSLDPRTLQLFNQGSEVAIAVDGEQDEKFNDGDVLLFYGQKTNTKFTNTNVYWLSWGANQGLRMSRPDGTPSGSASVPASFQTTLPIEQDKIYQRADPSGPDNDHWYWDLVFASSGPAYKDFTFQLNNLAPDGTTATLRGLLKGYSASPYHHTRIYLNGHLIDEALSWPSRSEYTFNVDLPQSYLVEGTNTIRVECPRDGSITQDIVLVNRFEIDYSRTYFAVNDQLVFDWDQPGSWEYRVDGFSANNIEIYDITAPLTPKRIQGAALQSTINGYQVSFQQQSSAKQRYLTLDASRRLKPLSILPDNPSNLKSASNSADYLIISHASFLNAVQPLATWRSSQGLRVQVVDVQDIYDEFNGGIFSPQAIRDFLAYAYANWARPAPSYVLLVGDGNYDFKNNLGWGEPNYIPPYLADADPWVGETAVDNRYVSVSGDDILPDMYIGRFPVKTPAEAQAMVTNVLAYEQNSPQGGLNGQLTFVADNADDAGDFAASSDAVITKEVPQAYTVEKIYYLVTDPTVSEMKSSILQALNQGRLMVHYSGHASVQTWGAESFIAVSDKSSLSQSALLPFLVSMTCIDGYFINPTPPTPPGSDYSSLAESLVRLPGKGSIASFSPTGFGSSAGHNLLDQSLLQTIFRFDQEEIGVATTQAKINLYAQSPSEQYLVDTYVLLGDPALHLQTLPKQPMIYLPFLQR